MAIDTTGGLVFHAKCSEHLLHVNMGNLGADGHVQRRLAPVLTLDLRPCGAAGQAKDRRECEVTVMQHQVRGHIVQGLVGHHHRLALEVHLDIDHPRQL